MNDLFILGGSRDPLKYKGTAPRETIFSAARHCPTDLPFSSLNWYLAFLPTKRLRGTLLATALRTFWCHSRREAAQTAPSLTQDGGVSRRILVTLHTPRQNEASWNATRPIFQSPHIIYFLFQRSDIHSEVLPHEAARSNWGRQKCSALGVFDLRI